jgi:hypothetical protein
MVEPKHFGSNPETASTNSFQATGSTEEDRVQALREFENAVEKLSQAGVNVHVLPDYSESPDAVFPNNWFSSHEEGFVLYPMHSKSRRTERATEIVQLLQKEYETGPIFDLSGFEDSGCFLEGTGSMVLDRIEKQVYACLSPRTDPDLLDVWADRFGYEVISFQANDVSGNPVYHTNVVLSMGTNWFVWCEEAIPEDDRVVIQGSLREGVEAIPIKMVQMESFCGNILELQGSKGPVLAVSETAWEAFTATQKSKLEKYAQPVVCPIPTIEKFGGGSLRCMIAECFWPRK